MKLFEFGGIDMAKFVGMPSAAFSIFLKKSECKIGLIEDEEMLSLFMNGIRGGMSFIGNRIIDTPLGGDYHTLYIDANNLYGLCQTFKLPYGKFKWRKKYSGSKYSNPKNFNKVIELIERYDMQDEHGYLLEVDLVNIISYKIQYQTGARSGPCNPSYWEVGV